MPQDNGTPAGKAGACSDLLGSRSHLSSNPLASLAQFSEHRQAALALLNGNFLISRKAGQFLGQLVVDPSPMSDKQSAWLAKLLERCGLPSVALQAGEMNCHT